MELNFFQVFNNKNTFFKDFEKLMMTLEGFLQQRGKHFSAKLDHIPTIF